jgi:hypothetical protein
MNKLSGRASRSHSGYRNIGPINTPNDQCQHSIMSYSAASAATQARSCFVFHWWKGSGELCPGCRDVIPRARLYFRLCEMTHFTVLQSSAWNSARGDWLLHPRLQCIPIVRSHWRPGTAGHTASAQHTHHWLTLSNWQSCGWVALNQHKNRGMLDSLLVKHLLWHL